MKKLFLSVPHSGEEIPEECNWLLNLPKKQQLQDADRFVDKLYLPIAKVFDLEILLARYSRYVVDLNREESHIESLSVSGSSNDIGKFSKKGLHWVETTRGEKLLPDPLSEKMHKHLVKNYYRPWHQMVSNAYRVRKEKGIEDVYQLDCHSMPSKATSAHADAGQYRPEVVISDFLGKSSTESFKNLVLEAFSNHFTQVNYNDPYIGGGITAKYGKPDIGQNCIQVELRRDLYMDEETKELIPEKATLLTKKLERVIDHILKNV